MSNGAIRVATRGPLFYGWIIVLALGCISIIVQGTANSLFGIVLVPIQHELGWSRAAISGAYSAGLVVWAVAGFPVGRLVDRGGARLLMSAGSALGGAALLLLAVVHSLWAVYLLWGLMLGLAIALTSQQVAYTVVANWFARRRGMAFAVVTGLAGLSLPLYVPVAGWITAHAGWRQAVAVTGLCLLLIALPLSAGVLRRRPEDLGLRPDGARTPAAVLQSGPATGFPLRQALRLPAFWTLTVSQTLSTLGFAAVSAHQIAYMIGRGFNPVLAASVVGGIGLTSMPGRVLFNLAGDRLGPKGLLALSLGLQGSGILVLMLASSVAWLVAYVIVYGSAFGTASGLRAALVADLFGRRAYGSITAVMGLVTYGGAALGPLGAGWLYDVTGGYLMAFGLAVAGFAIAAAAVVATPPTPAVPAAGPVSGGGRAGLPGD